jgi:signal transduction histidine kinase
LRLRSHLVTLVLAAVAPVLIFAAIIVWQDLVERREILDRGMRNTATAISLGIDGEVRESLAVLETLASSPFLDSEDFRSFYDLCVRAMARRPTAYVILFDATGRPLVHSSRAYGSPAPNPVTGTKPAGADRRYVDVPFGGGDQVKQAFATGATVISDLFVSLVTLAPRVSLDLPVVRDGGTRYVLEMSIDAQEFARLLAVQPAARDSILSLVDRRGVIVARTLDAEQNIGRRAAPDLAEAVARAASGGSAGTTLEGKPVYRALVRSGLTGWTTSLDVEKSVALAPLTESIALLTGGAALAVLLGLLAALLVGKRIQRPIAQLAGAAEALARGEPAELDIAAVRELQDLHRALVAAGASARTVAQAEAASRAKDEFLAMLSHELRNPLAALTSAAHVLKLADPSAEAAVKARRIVERQTKQMTRLVNDLLDISRIKLGKLALDTERLDLGDAVGRLTNVWRASGRFERHRVSLEVAPAWVDADRARIEQITANLLDNALKFTPPGKAIRITVGLEAGDAVLRVADEGSGLAAEDTKRVFELFVSHDANAGGLGIGLALVKRLAELHGGAVAVASEGPAKGATFTVRLPAKPAPALVGAKAAAGAARARRVLVVEDNDDARQMLAALLSLEGHEVRSARSAFAGFALASESAPELALIDIRLPDMDGYELARRLRGLPGPARIGLIALTGLAQPEDMQRAFEAGFDAHLAKPVSAERLKQVMSQLA